MNHLQRDKSTRAISEINAAYVFNLLNAVKQQLRS
jgi:hypothetical protein